MRSWLRAGAVLAICLASGALALTRPGEASRAAARPPASPEVYYFRPAPVAPRITIGSALAIHRAPFFGLDVPSADLATVSGLARLAGESPSALTLFVKLDSPLTVAKFTAVSAAGMTPFVTLEPWSYKSQGASQPSYTLASIYRGAHDGDLRRIAAVLAQAKIPMYFRFAQEMNGWWYPWSAGANGNQPGDYVKAWVHVHDLFAAAGATNLRWVWSPNTDAGTRSTPLSQSLPPAGYFDYAGLTCYAHSGTASSVCGPTLSKLEALTGVPLLLSEVGADGPGKAAWIASLTSLFAAHPRLAGFVWFNTTPQTTGASGDYAFDDNPSDVAAFRGMLAAR